MADDYSGRDRAGCGDYVVDDGGRVSRDGRDNSGSEWELVPSIAPETVHSLMIQPGEGDQPDIVCTAPNTNEILHMNYFALTSEEFRGDDHSTQHSAVTEATQEIHSDGCPSLAPEIDWVEPSAPVRSCTLSVTDEDDDSPSRSCSDESREGAQRQSPDIFAIASTYFTVSGPSGLENSASTLMEELQREFLTKGDSDAACRNRLTEDTGGSNIDTVETEVDDSSTSNEPGRDNDSIRWRPHLRAWLSEHGRANKLWSLGLAAAAIGLIVLGNGWQRFRLQYQNLMVRISSEGKAMETILGGVKPQATLISWSRGLESFPFSNFLV